ncbi:MAG TPA: hypothetical protein VGL93_10985 [Streptosporangiaceae bacterium]|jgi:hypothetical protein
MPSNAKTLAAALAVVVAASITSPGTNRAGHDRPRTPNVAAPAENTTPRSSTGRVSGPYVTATGPAKPGQ